MSAELLESSSDEPFHLQLIVPEETKPAVDREPAARNYNAQRQDNAIGNYLDLIGRETRLRAEEEVDLAKRIEAGLFAEKLLAVRAAVNPTEATDNRTSESELEKLEQPADERTAELGRACVNLASVSDEELKRLADDGKAAFDDFIKANLRLVVSIAKRYQHMGLEFSDLIQEGNAGLVVGVQKFDFKRGFKLSTHGTWWIRQAITHALANQSRTIRLPVHVSEMHRRMKKVNDRLKHELGREPTPEELASGLGIEEEKMVDLIRTWHMQPKSLDEPADDQSGESTSTTVDFVIDMDSPSPYDHAEAAERRSGVNLAMDAADLDEREKYVVIKRHNLDGGGPKTLKDVATDLGVTKEKIRQIESRACRKLARRQDLKAFLA